jgi:hypothetical protein
MDIAKSLRELPSAAWKAVKDYFAGLRLFFNRENWSHSITFILTLSIFIILALIQQPLRLVLWDPIQGVHQGFVNSIRVMVFGGCGAFVGFLLLALIAVFKRGQNLLFHSRFRHAISPLVVTISALVFIFLLPPLFIRFPNFMLVVFGPNGLFFTVFTWTWIITIFLQVILLGYTIVKSTKWLAEYSGIPGSQSPTKKYWLALIPLCILIPILIWAWFPLVFQIMIDGLSPWNNPPPIPLPDFVLWLLNLVPGQFRYYLLLVAPIIIIVTAIVLFRRLPSISIALAGFGLLYPALVYYYRLRVNQYFINWSYLPQVGFRPLANSGLFQVLLLVLTFVLVLLGAAKLQQNISPNPFGLFSLMIGTMVFVLFWVIIPDYAIGLGVEFFGMIGSALSAFLAIIVFVVLPICYAIYRLRQSPDVKTSEVLEESEDLKVVERYNETSE